MCYEQVTKEGLAARVVDRQQIYRTIAKEEIRHLFEFGGEESADMLDQSQEKIASSSQVKSVSLPPLSNGVSPSDRIMETLLRRHSRYVQHTCTTQFQHAPLLYVALHLACF